MQNVDSNKAKTGTWTVGSDGGKALAGEVQQPGDKDRTRRIAVGLIKFDPRNPYDGPGLHSAGACSSMAIHGGRNYGHLMFFEPDRRRFRIEYHPQSAASGDVKVGYIWEGRVHYYEEL